uniref:Uncharacterized protein n=1 Tax=Ciona savignyi TaxID=51511 RepID=H2YKL7_CIOSA
MRASSSSRVSLLRKSFAPRSPAVENTSMLSSPTVVMGGSHHNIESYPSSLPVLITEAITQADDFSEISAKLSATGWSVVVIQQRLFVWPHKPSWKCNEQRGQGVTSAPYGGWLPTHSAAHRGSRGRCCRVRSRC